MFNKVLILSASAGAGHVRAAQAIVQAFGAMRGAQEIFHLDILEYTPKGFRKFYANVQFDLARNAPELAGWFYDQFDKPWEGEKQRLLFEKLNTRLFVKLIQRHQPDLVVCTHFLPAEIISYLRAKGKIACKHAIIVTDYHVHAMWLCHHFERYFVLSDEAKEYLAMLGLDPSRITVTGMPLDPVFAEQKDKAAMRTKHGLKQDVPVILISAGGYGVGPMEQIIGSLLTMQRPAQVLALCGRNEDLITKIGKLVKKHGESQVEIVTKGFTNEMDELMSASDIMVGKPGGMTVAEAMTRGLPTIIVNPIPGQEEYNSDYLLEEGVALRCNHLSLLAFKIGRLLDNRQRLETLQRNTLSHAKPHAAREIVETLLNDQREGRM